MTLPCAVRKLNFDCLFHSKVNQKVEIDEYQIYMVQFPTCYGEVSSSCAKLLCVDECVDLCAVV